MTNDVVNGATGYKVRSGLSRRLAGLARMAVAALFISVVLGAGADGAYANALHKTFNAHAKHGVESVNHAAWNAILSAHLVRGEDGLNRFKYAKLKSGGISALQDYIAGLQAIDPTRLTVAEQFAFWVNLYNAKTAEIIAHHYPVASIRDIRLSLNPFSGPWKKKVVRVSGIDLSLDDIEHAILRPVWKDPRIHYAVNCASVGCPNLLASAYTGAELDIMLDRAARSYINSPRGVRIEGGKVTVSSLYDWYAEDFGAAVPEILDHIAHYAEPKLAKRLHAAARIDEYAYDWMLNDAK